MKVRLLFFIIRVGRHPFKLLGETAELTERSQKQDGSKWIQIVLHCGSGLSRIHISVITATETAEERGGRVCGGGSKQRVDPAMSGKV